MNSFFEFFNEDSVFLFCAISGAGLFILQCIVTLIGGDHSDNADESLEMDSSKIKLLSKQAIFGFLMMFGLVGLTCRKELEVSGPFTLGVSIGAGIIAVIVNALLFKNAKKLKSSGTIFRIEDSIEKEALVYQRIPLNGIGKITVSVNQFTYEIDAISQHGEELPSFTQVQIIKQFNDNTVVVAPIK